jgi:ATP-dependent DNA helicase RecQ
MDRREAEIILKERFHLQEFYDEQWNTIERIFKGERILLIERTGYGKSLCFQFPAIIFTGITVIFSPLIALMRDQVKKLNGLGIPARCINSEQSKEENTRIIGETREGKIKILYIAPERQENAEWLEATRQLNLSMVVVDEAHCISVWGHDFRPSFRRIINLVNLLPKGLPVLATTATATLKVQEDIAAQMGNDLVIIRGNLIRENFRFYVVKVQSEEEKMIWLGRYLPKIFGSGILYTGTRVDTEIYSRWFEYLNIPSIGYHAGLDPESRIIIENGLMNDQWKCIISTNALGMGIDKPDLRFIIHTQIPQSPVHYYQETGRAGRDGKSSWLILFYNPDDRDLPEAFIEGGRPSLSKYNRVINLIREELLDEHELLRKTNLKQNQFRVIKADLTDQKIIREITIGRIKKFEYITGAPPLNAKAFEELRESKINDLNKMIEYVETNGSRMKFLCDYLGDSTPHHFNNCDNTGLKKLNVEVGDEWLDKLQDFRDNYFPVLDTAPVTGKHYSNSVEFHIKSPDGLTYEIFKNHQLFETISSKDSLSSSAKLLPEEIHFLLLLFNLHERKEKLIDGVAASYYGFSNIGSTIHRCKYENGGDYPDFLLRQVLKAFRKKFGQETFDLVLYVPPTLSGDLVKNFAIKISRVLRFPISHGLIKQRNTGAQKIFENSILKSENVKEAFMVSNPDEITGKKILLIDDIYDSGATIKEIGRYLSKLGALKIAPLVIAKTVGGDNL